MNAGTIHRNREYKKERKSEDKDYVLSWPYRAIQVEKTSMQNMGAGVKDVEATVTLGGC